MMSKTLIEGVVGENVKLRRKLQSIKDNRVEIRKMDSALTAEKRKVELLKQRVSARSDKISGLRDRIFDLERELRQQKKECSKRVNAAQATSESLIKQLAKRESALRDSEARGDALHSKIVKIHESLRGLV